MYRCAELDEMLKLKQAMLLFCLCVQDQGLITPQDNMLKVLIILHEAFLDKLLCKVKSCVANELAKEEYNPNDVNNDDEFK